ncbi:helix-turn-helix domain-containing protein [Streptomyces endophytica]|uniref:Helix-turn-helix domain-containing protein n=1 Tax=Streptomyces endophytica TaxID=2991496 RepID=A0ABY6PJC2_9ACTN|nr:helix-turn-helix domain-containing protein [Streptomyces endophytica]UZJ33460.1 helix-turn-helix domain-containing protein [Streptomyces endophytica]
MSDTTPDSTSTQHPAPQPLTGLTEAQAAIYTQLVALTEPTTVIELALAAGVGKSTAGRALPMLEERGLAVRSPGGHDGPRRKPDLWYTAAMANEAISTPSNDEAPALAQPEPCTDDTTGPTSSSTEANDNSQEEPTPGATSSDTDSMDTCAEEDANAPQSDPSQDTEHNDSDGTSQNGTHSEEDSSNASAPRENPEPPTAPAPPAPNAEGRLAPGALRQMVIDHLQAHPDEAFTATRISRIIERSSGAIANALDKLVSQGIAEQVNDQPRTFRLTDPA